MNLLIGGGFGACRIVEFIDSFDWHICCGGPLIVPKWFVGGNIGPPGGATGGDLKWNY